MVSCATGSKCTSINSVVSTFPIHEERHNDSSFGNEDNLHQTKRITQSYNGLILKDSHAEVLARRGLMAVLWDEIKMALQNSTITQKCDDAVHPSQNLLDVTSERNKLGLLQFRLKSDLSLHMYISDSPCGDATIYEIKKLKEIEHKDDVRPTSRCCDSTSDAPEFETEINFTGAKIILSGNEGALCTLPTMFNQGNLSSSLSSVITFTNKHTTESSSTNQSTSSITVGREHIQQLGALRLKSSRSNIPAHLRSTSMSCADKLVRWGFFGLQGSVLMAFIPDPICLSSVCVSKDPRSVDGDGAGQLAALDRALRKRIECVLEWLQQNGRCLSVKPPVVAIVDGIFEDSKSESEHRYMMAQYNSRKRNACVGELPISNKKAKLCNADQQLLPLEVNPSQDDKTNIQQTNTCHTPCKIQRAKKDSPSGMSINWHRQQLHNTDANMKKNETEITIGATGLKRGKKPKREEDVIKSASRLCRYSFIRRWKRCFKLSIQHSDHCSKITANVLPQSRLIKEMSSTTLSYLQIKQKIVDTGVTSNLDDVFSKSGRFQGPLNGWVRSGVDGDFTAVTDGLER